VLSVDLVLPGFFPEQGIDTGIACTIDLEERVEFAVMEFAVAISEVVCDHQEELEQELGRRHRNRIGVEKLSRVDASYDPKNDLVEGSFALASALVSAHLADMSHD
jgi:hypothetical protein